MDHIVIIGAGQAGFSAASTLRKAGYEGRIALIGDEIHLPYQRPPLSKKYLLGEMSAERLSFRDADYFSDERIDLHLGCTVSKIDRVNKQVILENGDALKYDRLILTTGSRARHLPEEMTQGVSPDRLFSIRNLADIDRLQPHFVAGKRVLVLGGGYIGLEAAAVARQMKLDVTLVEMQDRLLARVTSSETSDYFAKLHRAHGVELALGTGLTSLKQEGEQLVASLSNGQTIKADLAIIGIGGLANSELAEQAGLTVNNGIVVNALGQTNDDTIYAAGDCCTFPYLGRQIRLESVQNAIDHASLIAKGLMGQESSYHPYPWFWSDQYDVKLQIAGLFDGYDKLVLRPGKDEQSCSHWYYRDDRLICVEALNDPRAYMMGKRWLEKGQSPDAEKICDPDADLKKIAV